MLPCHRSPCTLFFVARYVRKQATHVSGSLISLSLEPLVRACIDGWTMVPGWSSSCRRCRTLSAKNSFKSTDMVLRTLSTSFPWIGGSDRVIASGEGGVLVALASSKGTGIKSSVEIDGNVV